MDLYTVYEHGALREVKRVGVPKSPASAGNKTGDDNPIGESTYISKTIMPKIPDNIKTNKAKNIPKIEGKTPLLSNNSILLFSVPIIRIDIAIKTNNMISCKVS